MNSMAALTIFFVLTFAAAWFGSRFRPDGWYAGLRKPSFNPPNWIFAPVWGVLYLLMAIAAWRVWMSAGFAPAIVLWLVQLALNAGWSWLFFGRHRIEIALLDIVTLLVFIVATTAAFFDIDAWAGILLLPYLAWVAFATLLNFSLWKLNRDPLSLSL
ncbi:MAG TPA: TspO/MBR family protein [Paraburkholderia sp.]|nr:TspO/MBR family protein [Paraburkholderia sp.]